MENPYIAFIQYTNIFIDLNRLRFSKLDIFPIHYICTYTIFFLEIGQISSQLVQELRNNVFK